MLYKAEIIRRVSRETRYNQELVAEVWAGFEREIKQTLAAGDSVQLTGFGTFVARRYKATQVPDVQARLRGEEDADPITVPAGRTVDFRAGDLLKRAVQVRS